MLKQGLLLSSLLLCGSLGADPLSGPGRKTLVQADWGTIFCQESCSVKSDSWGRTFRLTSDKGPVTLSQTSDGWLIQSPNQNLRLRRQDGWDGSQNTAITFNSTTYRFERQGNDYRWILPESRVFFNLREGELRGALGPEGAFKLHKKNGGVAYEIHSEAGDSQVLLGRKKTGIGKASGYSYVVVRQEGEDLSRHPYLVRGVVFDNGPVGLFLRMPKCPVLEALDWSQVKSIASKVPFPENTSPASTLPASASDPLQAVEAGPDEDPMGLKRIKSETYRDMKNPAREESETNKQWEIPPKP